MDPFSTCLVVGMFLATPETTDVFYVELERNFNPVDFQLKLSEVTGMPVTSVKALYAPSLELLGAEFGPCRYYASMQIGE